jgi:hypothetical protein
MPPVLRGHRILEFQRSDGNAVNGQGHIECISVFDRVAELARNGELIGGIERLGVGIHSTGRGEIGNPKQLAKALEPVPEDGEAPLVAGIERSA